MFYNQPLSIRFGTELLRHIDRMNGIDPYWDEVDMAVAWVRASGISHLKDAFRNFLGNGGRLSFIVGIDLNNTTKDGLQALLDLETHGTCETMVHHNEAGGLFHPKVYLFRNEEEARLIVGSNNLTASGLFTNVEAGLQVDTALASDVVAEAVEALSSWRDETERLAVKLDAELLESLYGEGYVADESSTASAERQKRANRNGRPGRKLFGSRKFTAPDPASSPGTTNTSEPDSVRVPQSSPMGTVVLMRFRKSRRTQTQLPIRVAEMFFRGASSVVNVHTGESHGLHPASARGNRNTIKLEMPETREFGDIFARFEKTDTGIVYESYDGGTAKGNQIKTRLVEGMRDNTTQMSISDRERATWWLYI